MFGRIMPAPLLMPVTATGLPPIVIDTEAAFGTVSVVMIASAARAHCVGPAAAIADGRPASMRSFGQGLHDHAGRERQHLLGRAAEQRGQRDAGRACPRQTVGARTGIGVAGVDQDRPDLRAGCEVLAAQLHRRREEAIAREHSGHGGAGVERHDGQIAVGWPCGRRPSRYRAGHLPQDAARRARRKESLRTSCG